MRQWIALSLLALAASPTLAAECAVTVTANDAMQFDTHDIRVPASCKEFSVTLHHSGVLPATAMGHNWVLSRADDVQGVIADGMSAGAAADYVKPDDARVIAHTKLIGGGQSDTVSFPVSALKPDQPYAFVCTFPGHAALMKGTLELAQ